MMSMKRTYFCIHSPLLYPSFLCVQMFRSDPAYIHARTHAHGSILYHRRVESRTAIVARPVDGPALVVYQHFMNNIN